MSNNAPDYENDLVFPPASADVHTTKIEKQLEIAIKTLKDIERKLLTIDISNLSSRDRDKLYDKGHSTIDNVEEVLAPVPSYEEYLESEAHCAVYNEENKRLKGVVKSIKKVGEELDD